MKMRIVSGLLLITGVIVAGDVDRTPVNEIVFPQNMAIGAYHSIGFSNMVHFQPAEIGSANPASMSSFSAAAMGINFEYATKLDYLLDMTLDRQYQYLPTDAGFVYPLGRLSMGLGYQQKYNHLLDAGEIPLTTNEDPFGSSDSTFHPILKTVVRTVSGLISYSFPNLFSPEGTLSFGLQAGLDIVSISEDFPGGQVNADGNGMSWKIGVLYEKKDIYGIGLFFEKSVDIEITKSYGDSIGSFESLLILPDVISAGFWLSAAEDISLNLTAAYVLWKDLNDQFKNNLDISANIIYDYSESYAFSLGLFNTDRGSEENYFNIDNSATFLSLAARAKFSSFALRLEVADSHLGAEENRQQTQIKLGLDYSFK